MSGSPAAPSRALGRVGQRRIAVEAVRAFADPPAVVAALDDVVDLLPASIADVADEQPALAVGLPRQAPRVAEAVGVDLGRAAASRERVVGRDRVRRLAVDVQPRILPLSFAVSWALPCDE